MTKIMKSLSSQYTGVAISVQTWRQMTTRIALELFKGMGMQLNGDVIYTPSD
jgi:hypothetical protein